MPFYYTRLNPEQLNTLTNLMAAWLLLAGAAFWAYRIKLGISKYILISSARGLVQLLVLAFLLEYLFQINHIALQAAVIAGFCILAGHNSAGHHTLRREAWIAASLGLMAACIVCLPWLAWTGAISSESRTLIPIGSMLAANGMNAVSLTYSQMQQNQTIDKSIRAALIPTVDTLKVAGLVHMPGIFVGMVLAGANPLDAAAAQLTILYLIVASSFMACMLSIIMMNHFLKRQSCT